MEFQSFRKSFSGDTWTLYIVNQAGRGLTSEQPRILNPQTRYRYENLSWLLCSSGDQPLSSSRPFFAGWLWSSLEALILLSGIISPLPRRTPSAKPQTRNSVKETNFATFRTFAEKQKELSENLSKE